MELGLARTRFREEKDTHRLEKLTVSRTRGLLVVLHALATLALETPKKKSLRTPERDTKKSTPTSNLTQNCINSYVSLFLS